MTALQGELYFSEPDKFDDENDATVEFTGYVGCADAERLFQSFYEQGQITKDQAAKGISISPKEQAERFTTKYPGNKLFSQILKTHCICKTWDSIKMWNDYCGENIGICIGHHVHDFCNSTCTSVYDGQMNMGGVSTELPFFDVWYSDNGVPKMDVLDRFSKIETIVEQIFLHKGICFSDELEMRTMIVRNHCDWNKNTIKICDDVIEEIVFGIGASSELKNQVKEILLHNGISKVPFFDLEIQDILLFLEKNASYSKSTWQIQ